MSIFSVVWSYYIGIEAMEFFVYVKSIHHIFNWFPSIPQIQDENDTSTL